MQLDENQVTHHYSLRLRLVVKLVENDKEGKKRAMKERMRDILKANTM